MSEHLVLTDLAEEGWDDGCRDFGGREELDLKTLRVGDVVVTALPESGVCCDPKKFLRKFAAQLVDEFHDTVGESQMVHLPTTCFLVQTPGHTILVDAGIGNRGRPGQPMGYLDQRLQQCGVRPEDIDLLLNTHLHADHVGWYTIDDSHGQPVPFFPKASCAIQQAEWDYWMQPARSQAPHNAHLDQCVRPLMAAGRVALVGPDHVVTPEIQLHPTPGHTPGHVSVVISSCGVSAVIAGDVSHQPFQLNHPNWSPIWDVDPEAAAVTREAFFDEAVDDGRLFAAGHWPYPGFARITREGGRRVLLPV